MKIAYVVSDLSYPPMEGLHQQSVVLIQGLLEQGHSVDLYGFLKNADAVDHVRLLHEIGVQFRETPIVDSGSTLKRAAKNLGQCFARRGSGYNVARKVLEDEYDVVHWEGAAASVLASACSKDQLSNLISLVDPPSRRNFRLLRNQKKMSRKLKYLLAAQVGLLIERLLWRKGTLHVVSPEDAKYLKLKYPKATIVCIPVVIPIEIGKIDKTLEINGDSSYVTCLIYADLRQPHLRAAFDDLVVHVLNRDLWRGVKFRVMGRIPQPLDFERSTSIESIEFIEWAGDYVEEILRSDIVLLPDLVGTGLKNRAIQAMALGRPVIGTEVAFEGIPINNHKDGVRVRSWDEYFHCLNDLLANSSSRLLIGKSGQHFARQYFGQINVMSHWQNTYQQIIGIAAGDSKQ